MYLIRIYIFQFPVIFNRQHVLLIQIKIIKMTNEIPYEIPPELERFIHKLHLRTFEKTMPHVKEQFPDVTPQQVKHIIKSFVKDPRHLDQRKYYNPIFSDHPHMHG